MGQVSWFLRRLMDRTMTEFEETFRKNLIGMSLPTFSATAERRRLQLFNNVIGEVDPIYSDLDAARAAGYPDLPVPLTYLFALEYERPDPHGPLIRAGVNMSRILHAEQSFEYRHMVYAGQLLNFNQSIVDVFSKKSGALRFMVRQTVVTSEGECVAILRNTVVEQI